MAYNDEFNKLSALKIFYPASTQSSATIYGNGRNQVEVMVGVKILNSDQKPLIITEQELLSSIYLCDYYTGEKVSSGNAPDWNYSNQKNEYAGALEYTSARIAVDNIHFSDDGYNYLKLYLYCKKRNDGKVIAAGINIPNVGEFNTTANGTLTPNGSSGSPFKMPGHVTAKALEPHKYTISDFSLNQETSSISSVWNQGAQLYKLSGTNYYLDISKPSHKISSLKPSNPSGSIFGSNYSWYWIWQAFDCAADYGKKNLSKILIVRFAKYEFPCVHTINRQPGACFTLISGQSTVMTSWYYSGQTYVDIIDQYGNYTSPLLSFHDNCIKHTGFYSGTRDISECTARHVSNYGVPEDIVQHIADSAPDMICGILSPDDNNSGFKPCVNASPAPEQGAIIDADFLRTLRDSHEITHVICSVPDALSHDVADYQEMSDRDGLPYLLVLWPSLQCLNIFPQSELEYENRPYIYGQYDCYSLIRDYLLREKGFVLNDYPREVYSIDSGKNIFEVQAPEEGFVRVEDASLQSGDILVFNLPSTRLQHAAVYIGNGQMLHHLPPGQSRQETCSESWKKRISSVWRHQNLINK
ncbi:NlpC/P60 family protein [Serratia quinivorans]|uniref:NlpC/P60 family protein n=1 Tax=Serratia quinivorans TaxID=137545 RepID=UPI00107E9B54|nr:NlpC/P60 family protein [Serratia quinivorans]QBX68330.1 hypothetical protein E4343_20100 [Serratia quinivorans]